MSSPDVKPMFIERIFNRSKLLRSFLTLLLLFALLSISALPVFAQTFRGKIVGTITDPQGAVVAGANVKARNTGTGIERLTTTDEAGNYAIAELPIGDYEVSIDVTGFRPAKVSNVKVEVAGVCGTNTKPGCET